jgi:hypothetical protein
MSLDLRAESSAWSEGSTIIGSRLAASAQQVARSENRLRALRSV